MKMMDFDGFYPNFEKKNWIGIFRRQLRIFKSLRNITRILEFLKKNQGLWEYLEFIRNFSNNSGISRIFRNF
jgi:uncharacterized protein YpiB (UPF0302 family)